MLAVFCSGATIQSFGFAHCPCYGDRYRHEMGAKLVVVDPRNAGLAHRVDEWLQVRPGSDGALALDLSHVMIEHEWYDADFLRAWTNAPFLVGEVQTVCCGPVTLVCPHPPTHMSLGLTGRCLQDPVMRMPVQCCWAEWMFKLRPAPSRAGPCSRYGARCVLTLI